jgi:hypothetical protein
VTFRIPELSKQSLRRRGIAPAVDAAIEFIVECLHDACALVAEDTGRDRHDDRTSKGFLRWRRGRNIIIERIAEEGPSGARVVEMESATQVDIGEYRISFYSAREGVGQPDLSGTSKTKRHVVGEMQMQLEGLPGEDGPKRLALLYEADGEGLKAVAVGVLASTHEWAWQVTAYRRDDVPATDDSQVDRHQPRHSSYDQQPVSELPPLRPKKKTEKERGADKS